MIEKTRIKIIPAIEPLSIAPLGKPECKGCLIGNYIRVNFLNLQGSSATCSMCIDRPIQATVLPLSTIHTLLNKKKFDVIKEVYYPSINNFCPKCKEEQYDDGKGSVCQKCNVKPRPHFSKQLKRVPNWHFKHQFNKIYHELKNVFIPEQQEEHNHD